MMADFTADFTVVICTYNGAQRLPAVLDALRSQQGIDGLVWDVLVVDNNSSDATADVIRAYQARGGTPPIHYCFEPKQGLAFARRRAIATIFSPLLGFLDDDTVPSSTWVSAAYQFGKSHPEAGAYGSEIQGQFEVEPPPNFRRIETLLALIRRGSTPFQYSSANGVLPAGAGMVIRRDVWLKHVPEQPTLAGVSATSLASKGEDVETLSYIRHAGYPIWHNPAMRIYHQIPKERLAPDYLFRLCQAVGLNRYPLRMLKHPRWQRPAMSVAYAINDARRLFIHVFRNWQQLKRGELIAQCELRLKWYSLISCLFGRR